MFDPLGLKSRYAHLVEWKGGLWVNYWTQTPPRLVQKQASSSNEILLDNDEALLTNGIISSGSSDGLGTPDGGELQQSSSQPAEIPRPQDTPKQNKQAGKSKVKRKNKQEKGQELKSGKHFIVLPVGVGRILGGIDKWEQVLVGGVEDEVSAHTGLFMPNRNLDYEGLVERVEAKILDWCENLSERH